jgi:hypothetical protein
MPRSSIQTLERCVVTSCALSTGLSSTFTYVPSKDLFSAFRVIRTSLLSLNLFKVLGRWPTKIAQFVSISKSPLFIVRRSSRSKFSSSRQLTPRRPVQLPRTPRLRIIFTHLRSILLRLLLFLPRNRAHQLWFQKHITGSFGLLS